MLLVNIMLAASAFLCPLPPAFFLPTPPLGMQFPGLLSLDALPFGVCSVCIWP
jgi:hypothetical protein